MSLVLLIVSTNSSKGFIVPLMHVQIVYEVFVLFFLCQGWFAQLGLHWHRRFGYGWFDTKLLMVLHNGYFYLLVTSKKWCGIIFEVQVHIISARVIDAQESSSDIL